MRIKPDDKYWKSEYTNTKKLALEYGQDVTFNVLPPGLFVYKGLQAHLELVEKYLDDEIDKGLQMSKLDISLALQEALKTVDVDDVGRVAEGILSDFEENEEPVPMKKRKYLDENYSSSPEVAVETERTLCESGNSKTAGPGTNSICSQCNQFVDKNKQVEISITKTG